MNPAFIIGRFEEKNVFCKSDDPWFRKDRIISMLFLRFRNPLKPSSDMYDKKK